MGSFCGEENRAQRNHMDTNDLVALMSTETIKPSSLCFVKPYKLSFIDQYIPSTYVPLILFYPPNQPSEDPNFSSTLKRSLSQTLATFFPFSGRLKDNHFVHNFVEGVPFSETKLNTHLSEFLEHPQLDKLNKLLPTQPYTQVSLSTEPLPVLYAQLNNFQCGGIALAVCFLHKISDIHSICNFLQIWSENNCNIVNRSPNEEAIALSFDEVSQRFPLNISNPSRYVSIMEKLFFKPGKRTTRRFVFNTNAIASLQEKATTESESEAETRPTRIKTLSSFIWKRFTMASASISSTPRMSLSVHAVNIRKKTEPFLPQHSIGNLVWLAVAAYDILDSAEHDARMSSFKEFVELTNQSVEDVNVEFLKSLEGENGTEVATQFLDLLNETSATNPDIMMFSSWVNFGIKDFDFDVRLCWEIVVV